MFSQFDFIDDIKEVKEKKLNQVMDLVDSFKKIELHSKEKRNLDQPKSFSMKFEVIVTVPFEKQAKPLLKEVQIAEK